MKCNVLPGKYLTAKPKPGETLSSPGHPPGHHIERGDTGGRAATTSRRRQSGDGSDAFSSNEAHHWVLMGQSIPVMGFVWAYVHQGGLGQDPWALPAQCGSFGAHPYSWGSGLE